MQQLKQEQVGFIDRRNNVQKIGQLRREKMNEMRIGERRVSDEYRHKSKNLAKK
jgi:hypothetical protein